MNCDQLKELYILEPEDLNFIKENSTDKNQVAFTIMLKFYQHEKRYPTSNDIIDNNKILYIKHQLSLGLDTFSLNQIPERTLSRFKSKIRNYLGYRSATLNDAKTLINWLVEQSKDAVYNTAQYRELAYQFLDDKKFEPFTSDRIDRYIASAVSTFEKQFFANIINGLSPDTLKSYDEFLLKNVNNDNHITEDNNDQNTTPIDFRKLKTHISGIKLKNVELEIGRLNYIRRYSNKINDKLFNNISRKVILKYYQRIMAASPSNILEFVPVSRYSTLTCFFYIRSQILSDELADLFTRLMRNLRLTAEKSVDNTILNEIHKVNGKFDILCTLADTALNNPTEIIEKAIYPKVSKETLKDIIDEMKHGGSKWYQNQVNIKMRSLYSHAHRKCLLLILDTFIFKSNLNEGKEFIEALNFIKLNKSLETDYYPNTNKVPYYKNLSQSWQNIIKQNNKIRRSAYELAILELLTEKLKYKLIWIEGTYRYRNPDEDLPKDWDTNREQYYQKLNLPLEADEFIKQLETKVHTGLSSLNNTIPNNDKVKILDKNNGHIKISPSEAQPEPTYLEELQREIISRWSTINLIDMLKESELRLNLIKRFHSVAEREILGGKILQKRLLLCLFGIGSNTGLKRISAANLGTKYSDLNYVKRRFINEDNVKAAIIDVVNDIIEIRDPEIWGEATTGCACDSTLVSSWDQNLMSSWHPRYRGNGIMIYWHVDQKSTVIHSQVKTCLSSEVGAMLTGVLKHDTKMNMNKTYVDTHGQSTIGYAFSYGLSVDLLARIKGIHKLKLYYPSTRNKDTYPNLKLILKSAINTSLIKENYDEYVKLWWGIFSEPVNAIFKT
jgi:hypothetical protein